MFQKVVTIIVQQTILQKLVHFAMMEMRTQVLQISAATLITPLNTLIQVEVYLHKFQKMKGSGLDIWMLRAGITKAVISEGVRLAYL